MTLAEFRNLIIAEYKIQVMQRGTNEIELPEQLIAMWISMAQNDIATRLGLSSYYTDQTLTAGTNGGVGSMCI